MQGIILLSHGSVLCGAERNLLELAARMRDRGDAPIIEAAFLNYTEPGLAAAVERCVEQGATRIVVAPYFLIAGKFVIEDLPATIDRVRLQHPGMTFEMAGVIGFHPLLADAVLASARGAQRPEDWNLAGGDTRAWCREQRKCPLYGSEACRVQIEVPA